MELLVTVTLQAGVGRSLRDGGLSTCPWAGCRPSPFSSTAQGSHPCLPRKTVRTESGKQGFWGQFCVDQGSPDAPVPLTTPQLPLTLPDALWKFLSGLSPKKPGAPPALTFSNDRLPCQARGGSGDEMGAEWAQRRWGQTTRPGVCTPRALPPPVPCPADVIL